MFIARGDVTRDLVDIVEHFGIATDQSLLDHLPQVSNEPSPLCYATSGRRRVCCV